MKITIGTLRRVIRETLIDELVETKKRQTSNVKDKDDETSLEEDEATSSRSGMWH